MDSDKWQQIKDVFNATLAVAERDRAAYLLSRCGGDAVLLDELRSLFKAHDEYDGFIDSPACRSINSFVSETKVPSRIGHIVGTYRIESEIGRGGMGTVYLATRADREFDKKVAIKLINRGLDTDEIIKRFCYERQILAALEHPYITRLLDGGSTKDGLPFLVMDYVDGALLNVYCDREELSIRERLELFLQICSAVSYAHQNLV